MAFILFAPQPFHQTDVYNGSRGTRNSLFCEKPFVQWKLGHDAVAAAKIIRPYEDIDPGRRFGHFHAPVGEQANLPAVVFRQFGHGKVCTIAASLAEDYFRFGSRHIRQMLLNVIDILLDPAERIVEVETLSPSIEISLMSQRTRWILHLNQYGAKRHTGNTVIEELPIREDIPIHIRTPNRPKNVYLAPSRKLLKWSWKDNQVHAIVPELHIHQMVVMEW